MTSTSARLETLFERDERPLAERQELLRLMELFADLPPPPDPYDLCPRYAELKAAYLNSLAGSDPEALEEAFLALYSHVHGYEVPFTASEKRRFDALDGYLNHVGGLSPLVKAAPFISRETVSGDFGAGNGLQGLLLQVLYPHAKTLQVELSSRLVAAGRELQGWLGIPRDRVEWIAGDVMEVSPTGLDFVYLYRPVRPHGPGRTFYEHFAAELERSARSPIVFSVADGLGDFLSPRFEVFHDDGHLKCFRRRGG